MTLIYKSCAEAIDGIIKDGSTIMAGGFGLCGIPENLIKAICDSGKQDLTIISNNCGIDNKGLGILLQKGQIKKMISSYVGENKTFAEQINNKQITVELVPQGTLAEKIRAGGAGIPAFYTATGYGTTIAEGKEVKTFNNRQYILEESLFADIAIIKGYISDTSGNIIYKKTARNFNPIMATAATTTIAEVEKIVEIGTLDPDQIHTPNIFIKRLVQGSEYEKPIEMLTTRDN
ncbi:MAG: CoA transferase subunit A [Rickettsiales bacterium]|nr:CoA transferase subunit A [Rickettsiales bacterium]